MGIIAITVNLKGLCQGQSGDCIPIKARRDLQTKRGWARLAAQDPGLSIFVLEIK